MNWTELWALALPVMLQGAWHTLLFAISSMTLGLLLGFAIALVRLTRLPVLAPLAHQPSWLQVAAERAVSRALGGSCTVPLAAHALFSGVDELLLQAAWGAADGSLLRAQCQATCTSIAEAEQIGMTVAQRLIQQGAVVAG